MENKNDLEYAELEDTDTSKVEDANLSSRVESRLPDFSFEDCMTNLNHAPYIVMIGARFSGKSHGIPELVFHLDKKFKYKNCFCISNTAKMNDAFPFMKQENIYDDLDVLDRIIEIRKQSFKMEKKCCKDPILIILDDVSGLRSKSKSNSKKNIDIRYNEALEFAATTGRHYHLHFIIAIQGRSMVSKLQRCNASITYVWTPKSITDKKMVTEEYLALAKSKDEREAMVEELYSQPNQCLVIEGHLTGVCKTSDYCRKYVFPEKKRKFKMKHLKKRRSKRNEEFSGAEGGASGAGRQGKNMTNEKLIEKNNSQRIFNINTY